MKQTFNFKLPIEINYNSRCVKGFTFGSHNTEASLSYEMDIIFNKAGIDQISVNVPDQEIYLKLELDDIETGEVEDFYFTLKLSEISIDHDVDDFSLKNGISPQRLDLEISQLSLKSKTGEASGTLYFRS